MTRNLYAFLVGIDTYPSPVNPLHGCVNDVKAFARFLEAQQAKDHYELHLDLLTNEAATRQAVIDGFHNHLCQAGPDDVALFYYAGHGSQEMAPVEFWQIEPDHHNETLVLYDSRTSQGRDLADKELGFLIFEVAEKGGHVVVVLDSCHSGSGTRDTLAEVGERWEPADTRARHLETYLFSPLILNRQAARNVLTGHGSNWLDLPEGRHVLLAACADRETSKEVIFDGQHRGAFSYFLERTLLEAGSQLTYRDLHNRVCTGVLTSVIDQTPQLETSAVEELDRPFLGGAVRPRPSYFGLHHDPSQGWILDAGLLHGLQKPRGDETTWLAVYPMGVDLQNVDLSDAIAQVKIMQALPHKCLVQADGKGKLETDESYVALIARMPLPPLEVALRGEEEGLELVRQALEHSGLDGGPSPYVRQDGKSPTYCLWAKAGEYRITLPSDDRPVCEPTLGYTKTNSDLVVNRLEHIARWKQTLELNHPASRLAKDAVRLHVSIEGRVVPGSDVLAEYVYRDGEWQRPSFTIKLTNQSDQRLYVSLLSLAESFSIGAPFFPAGSQELAPGQSVTTPVKYGSVPDRYWAAGITERRDVFKLIASTHPFDPRLLVQSDIPTYLQRGERRDHGPLPSGVLNRLAARLQTREIEEVAGNFGLEDWVTSEFVMTTRRPQEFVPISETGSPIPLGSGVTLSPHPGLKARARLASLPHASRDATVRPLPAILEETQPLYFNPSRGADPGLSVLELTEIEGRENVGPNSPLFLDLPFTLDESERILPVAFDGEFYLPLGHAVSHQDRMQIVINRLPEPMPLEERDLKGAIRIFFQKIISKPLGLKYEYPILAAASPGKGGEIKYEVDTNKVAALIKDAQHITLFIHGFTGDTRTMIATARQYLSDDLLLTFDYESVNTSIEKTARNLKLCLNEVGLRAGHSKQLRIIAHSLGGIITRWFIEQIPDGNNIVQQAICLGTPSEGTPWPTVQQWSTVGLGLVLNALTTVVWPVKALGWLVNAFETVDVTLDEIQPGSEQLETLKNSDDPHVPYTLIAGNTSIVPEAVQGGEQSRLADLLRRLGYNLATMVFFGQPNDIAVSVDSVHSVDIKRSPAPKMLTATCDHVSFFSSAPGLNVLKQAVKR